MSGSSGRQADVPRGLKTIARRECRRQGLNGDEPVLTVGPPDNFETHKSNLKPVPIWQYYGRAPF